ncbi:MAG: T9SS type A sorting domain-containing protein [Bacteroidales bacterium]|nr:T9SS type A sorting domain-containing protein [Bacteroidales bacterium]
MSFRIPEVGHVKVMVYNQAGQLVAYLANEDLPEGVHERMWHPGSLAPGAYFIHLESGGMVSVRKAVLAR